MNGKSHKFDMQLNGQKYKENLLNMYNEKLNNTAAAVLKQKQKQF